MSIFSNFKIKWPKSVDKLENGGRLDPSAKTPTQKKKKTVRWIRLCLALREVDVGAYSKALSGGRNNCTMREKIDCANLCINFHVFE